VNNIRDHTSTAMCDGSSDLTLNESETSISPGEGATAPAIDPSESPATETPKRVLLLEDDSTFREIITTLLTESGYEVKAVQSGVEGIQEVLAGDFAVILCDMMMPGLPGDLFFHAVDRARPHLCERFVFMTGRRGDAVANDFISAVLAPTLHKPFGFQELFGAIQEVQQREVVHGRPAPHAIPPRPPRPTPVPASPTPITTKPVARPDAKCVAVVNRVSPARLPPVITELYQSPTFGINLSIALLFVSIMTLLVGWRFAAEGRTAKAWMEARDLEERWNLAAEKLEAAKQDMARREKVAERATKIITEFQQRRWAPALEKIVACTTAQIQLEKFGLQQDLDGSDSPNRWSLHIAAQAAGSAFDADYFRHSLKKELDLITGANLEVVLTDPGRLQATAPGTQDSNVQFAIETTNVPISDPFSSPRPDGLK